MFTFKDGQHGRVVWYAPNSRGEVFGEFTSTTGARFAVRDSEVQAVAEVAALNATFQSEWMALSANDRANIARDFTLAMNEDKIGAIEYRARIGAGNLQAYANCLRPRAAKAAQ